MFQYFNTGVVGWRGRADGRTCVVTPCDDARSRGVEWSCTVQESDQIIVSLLCDLVYPGLVNLDSVFAADEAWRRCGRATPLVTVSSPGPQLA